MDGLVEASRQSRVCGGAANEIMCAIFRVLMEVSHPLLPDCVLYWHLNSMPELNQAALPCIPCLLYWAEVKQRQYYCVSRVFAQSQSWALIVDV